MKPLQIGLIAYGAINVAGGVAGYAMKQSIPSLISGGIFGAILIWCGLSANKNPGLAYRLAGGITLLLALFWAYGTFKSLGDPSKLGMHAGNLLMAVGMFAWMGGSHMAAVKKA